MLAVLRLLVLELLRGVDRRAADTCRHVMLRLISLVVGLLLLVIKVVLIQLWGRFPFAKLTEYKSITYEVRELLHPCLPGTVHGLVPCGFLMREILVMHVLGEVNGVILVLLPLEGELLLHLELLLILSHLYFLSN